MKQHTKGPWKYNYYPVESKHYIESAGSEPIAELAPLTGVASEEVAKGFLLAAAPELLEALRLCYEELDRIKKRGEGVSELALGLAEAAIAKAEGDSK